MIVAAVLKRVIADITPDKIKGAAGSPVRPLAIR
jgi:hypothetical protein